MSGNSRTTADAREPGHDSDLDAEGSCDPTAAADRIHRRAETIRRTELDAALGRLSATDELTAAQRRTVARMTERITETLVASPTEALLAAEDAAAVATVLKLFGDETGPE
jgi:glutamyl-tRNA reductase